MSDSEQTDINVALDALDVIVENSKALLDRVRALNEQICAFNELCRAGGRPYLGLDILGVDELQRQASELRLKVMELRR